MKKMLAKSERIIQLKSYWVEVLEKHISTNGLDVPTDEYAHEDQTFKLTVLEQP